ncbi:unnamed protein product, partial [Laminaria digitata]
ATPTPTQPTPPTPPTPTPIPTPPTPSPTPTQTPTPSAHNKRMPPPPPPPPRSQPRSTANAIRKPCTPLKSAAGSTTTTMSFTRRPHQAARQCYAIDTEMVTVVGPGGLPARRAMVSVGIVNDRLETILYGRVAVPRGCEVTDGAFARVEGGLWASWEEGIPASCVSDLVKRHASSGGIVVGWEVHGDLEVIGFEKAASQVQNGERERLPLDRLDQAEDRLLDKSQDRSLGRSVDRSSDGSLDRSRSLLSPTPASPAGPGGGGMQVVEVTDHFRTMKGLKCTLVEAYACCFDRTGEGAHNAATDARMTMELYNLWRRAGEPGQPLGVPLSFFVVNFHSFKPSWSRHSTLWGMLRPGAGVGSGVGVGAGVGRGRRLGPQTAIEADSGNNTYK